MGFISPKLLRNYLYINVSLNGIIFLLRVLIIFLGVISMEETNIILFLWRMSFFISIICLFLGVVKRSWLLMLISTITFLPIAYYFLGAVNYFKLVGFVPIILFSLAILFWFLRNIRKNSKK